MVTSKHNDDNQYIWESDANSFSIIEDPRGNTLQRGTQVSLYLKDEARDFLEIDTIRNLVQKYSQFINFNIYLWTSKVLSIRDTAINKKYSLFELLFRPRKSKSLSTMKPNQRRRRQLMKRRTQRSRRKLRKRSPRLVKLRRPRGIGNCLTMLNPSGPESQSHLKSVHETHLNSLLCICTGLQKWKKRNTRNFTKPSPKILSPLSLIFISWLKVKSLSNPCFTSRLSNHRRASTNMVLVPITSK